MEKTKDSFIFYRSFFETLEDLPDDLYIELVKAICQLALNGTEIELQSMNKTLFKLIKPQILANNKKYTDGLKGGRPKKTTGFKNQKPNDNDNAHDNVNVNEHEEYNDNNMQLSTPQHDDNINNLTNNAYREANTQEIILYFNQINNIIAKPNKPTINNINKLLAENYTIDDFKLVINFMADHNGYYVNKNRNSLSVLADVDKFNEKLETAQQWNKNKQKMEEQLLQLLKC